MAELSDSMKPQVFDVLSCEFGCNSGAGTGNKNNIFDIMKVMREVEKEARGRRKTSGGFFRGAEDKLFKRFDEELSLRDFFRNYVPATPSKIPTESELEPIFKSMGKNTSEERKLDCHACGYRSCRQMAIAIYRGLNTPDNCIVHAKSALLARHSEITNKNSKLSDIADRCLMLSEKMTNDMSNVTNNMTVIREANEDTHDRANKVHDLLGNVIAYCQANESMSKDETIQLIQILQTTLSAFDNLYDSVKKSTGSTLSVDSYILEIDSLVSSISKILKEAETEAGIKDTADDLI
jgi:hypothetical protein